MAAEHRDEDTGTHILRMSNYAAAIARKLGMDDAMVNSIKYAVPLHDVGKIGIPDHILLKPGKLTAQEFDIMKKHTTIGASILSDSDAEFIKLAEIIAIGHHEKWDGNGYPEGLAETNIPMAARVTAVPDVFDALTTKRPYKGPLSVDESFGIMREGRGSHFCPEVVDAFFDIEDEILSIRDRFKDQDDRNSLLAQMTEEVAGEEES